MHTGILVGLLVVFAIAFAIRASVVVEQLEKAVAVREGVGDLRNGWVVRLLLNRTDVRVRITGSLYQIELKNLLWFDKLWEPQLSQANAEDGAKRVLRRIGEIRDELSRDGRVVWPEPKSTLTDWPGP